jgi:hypothetical protein
MRFTVTSGVGVTEVVDRPESPRAALEHVLVYSGVSEAMFASWMRTARLELRRIYAGWQPRKLQCCPIIKTELLRLS